MVLRCLVLLCIVLLCLVLLCIVLLCLVLLCIVLLRLHESSVGRLCHHAWVTCWWSLHGLERERVSGRVLVLDVLWGDRLHLLWWGDRLHLLWGGGMYGDMFIESGA